MKGRNAGTILKISEDKEQEFKKWLESLKNNPLPNWKNVANKQWEVFIQSTIDNLSNAESARLVNVCPQTIYLWRKDLASIFNGETPKLKIKDKVTYYYVYKKLTKEERNICKWLHCKSQNIEEFKKSALEFRLFIADLVEQPNDFKMKQKSWLTLKEMIITGEKQTDIAKKLNVSKECISQRVKKLIKFFNLRNSLCDRYKLSKRDAIDIIIESKAWK